MCAWAGSSRERERECTRRKFKISLEGLRAVIAPSWSVLRRPCAVLMLIGNCDHDVVLVPRKWSWESPRAYWPGLERSWAFLGYSGSALWAFLLLGAIPASSSVRALALVLESPSVLIGLRWAPGFWRMVLACSWGIAAQKVQRFDVVDALGSFLRYMDSSVHSVSRFMACPCKLCL